MAGVEIEVAKSSEKLVDIQENLYRTTMVELGECKDPINVLIGPRQGHREAVYSSTTGWIKYAESRWRKSSTNSPPPVQTTNTELRSNVWTTPRPGHQ